MIRLATRADAAAIAAIYNHYIRETVITFEEKPLTPEEMELRIADLGSLAPWLVHETDRAIDGYAHAAPHHPRVAYRWAVNVSVYLRDGRQGKGIGRKLYEKLLTSLCLQGFHVACGGITLPNEASVGLHEALGFQLVGTYASIGFKHAAWRDVGWWQLRLREAQGSPREPMSTVEFLKTVEGRRLLKVN